MLATTRRPNAVQGAAPAPICGPRGIQNCTDKELDLLREKAGGCIKFLALYREGQDVMVLAQAKDKMTPRKWMEQLGCSAQHLRRLDDLRGAVDRVLGKAGFEEHGEICKKQHFLGCGSKRMLEESEAARSAGTSQAYKETEQSAFELAGQAYKRRQAELELQYSRQDAYDQEA
jgi:hypothetical protein